MDRKAIANETLRILTQGYYIYQGAQVDISAAHQASVADSELIAEGQELPLLERLTAQPAQLRVSNTATIKAIRDFASVGATHVGVLNFASAKNPGGGFLNGAMAQEESLAASSGLYETLTAHPDYYSINRAWPSMIYTDNAIYSPDVVFFRDERFALVEQPVTASVLTLPAVNFGQIQLKSDDTALAKAKMKARMRLVLSLFAAKGDRNLVLGAYGCGVFRNDPTNVAAWWQELLSPFNGYFDKINFAVLDTSKGQACIRAFEAIFGKEVPHGTK